MPLGKLSGLDLSATDAMLLMAGLGMMSGGLSGGRTARDVIGSAARGGLQGAMSGYGIGSRMETSSLRRRKLEADLKAAAAEAERKRKGAASLRALLHGTPMTSTDPAAPAGGPVPGAGPLLADAGGGPPVVPSPGAPTLPPSTGAPGTLPPSGPGLGLGLTDYQKRTIEFLLNSKDGYDAAVDYMSKITGAAPSVYKDLISEDPKRVERAKRYIEMRRTPAPSVTVINEAADDAMKPFMEGVGKQMADTREQAKNARLVLKNYETMDTVLGDLETGKITTTARVAALQAKKVSGVASKSELEELGRYEAAEALAKQSGLDALKAIGGNDTERELEVAISLGPDAGKSAPGRANVRKLQRIKTKRLQEYARVENEVMGRVAKKEMSIFQAHTLIQEYKEQVDARSDEELLRVFGNVSGAPQRRRYNPSTDVLE